MAVAKPRQLATPARSISEFTVGRSDNKPDLSTAATSPNIGNVTQNPTVISLAGMTSQKSTALSNALAANTYGLAVGEIALDLPSLLNSSIGAAGSNPGSITFGANDLVMIWAQLFWTNFPVALSTATTIVTPYGLTDRRVRIRGPFLPGNISFAGFGVFVSFYATTGAAALSAGTALSCRIDAMLLDLIG